VLCDLFCDTTHTYRLSRILNDVECRRIYEFTTLLLYPRYENRNLVAYDILLLYQVQLHEDSYIYVFGIN
jgi:hypothetical protein